MATLKRQKWLIHYSHEHHYALQLCWKIRKGIQMKSISPERIKRYADWFYHEVLLPHIQDEEVNLFPVLNEKDENIQLAIFQHRELQAFFANTDASFQTLNMIADKLESHIRFEERILFELIQRQATEQQIEAIKNEHKGQIFKDNEEDVFWI